MKVRDKHIGYAYGFHDCLGLTLMSLTRSPSVCFPMGILKLESLKPGLSPLALILTLPFCRRCQNQHSQLNRPTMLLFIPLCPWVNHSSALTPCKLLFFLKYLDQLQPPELAPLGFSFLARTPATHFPHYNLQCIQSPYHCLSCSQASDPSFCRAVAPHSQPYPWQVHSKYLWAAWLDDLVKASQISPSIKMNRTKPQPINGMQTVQIAGIWKRLAESWWKSNDNEESWDFH